MSLTSYAIWILCLVWLNSAKLMGLFNIGVPAQKYVAGNSQNFTGCVRGFSFYTRDCYRATYESNLSCIELIWFMPLTHWSMARRSFTVTVTS